jgi:3-oxoacyl-[acyl-carrier-protein] synthase-3
VQTPGAVITGWGFYVPERVLTNRDLERLVGTTDEWIVERTGIRERRIVADDESTATMATRAARHALERAGIAGSDLDVIIVGTTTPDYLLPTAAALVQEQLGAHRAGILDLGAACAGFIYGLSVARGLIAAGTARRILVIGAETISRYVDWSDRATCVLFGDGAGAVIVEASESQDGIVSTVLHGDGSKREFLTVKGGGSKHPPTAESVRDGLHFIRMQGNEVFKLAVPSMASAAEEAIKAAGLRLEDIDLLVPHQANLRIIDAVAKRLRLDRAKVFVNIEKYGNTSAASIPIALCEAVADGRVRQGDRLVFAAFGGGMTWGAAVVRWTAPVLAPKRWAVPRWPTLR